jgi:hypothetical protein
MVEVVTRASKFVQHTTSIEQLTLVQRLANIVQRGIPQFRILGRNNVDQMLSNCGGVRNHRSDQ